MGPEPTWTGTAPSPVTPAAVLRRWEDQGGTWRVVGGTRASVAVALCRCDGGEEVERITSDDPGLRAYLGGRTSSDEPPAP